MKPEPWELFIVAAITVAIFPYIHDFVSWLDLMSASFRNARELILTFLLSFFAACTIYRFFLWVDSIPGDDPRMAKAIKERKESDPQQ